MGRFYLLNTKKDIMNFNFEFQRILVINDALTKKSLFCEYVYRYKQLFGMNLSEMQSEVNIIAKEFVLELYPDTYANVDMVTESVMSSSNSHWVEATEKAVLRVYDELSRVCIVKGVESHETVATAMVHELRWIPKHVFYMNGFVCVMCV